MHLFESFEKKERELALIVKIKHILEGGITQKCPYSTVLFLLGGRQ